MKSWRAEPSLLDMLNDPIVRLVMRRDGVASEDLRRLLEGMRRDRDPDGKRSLERQDKSA